MSKDCDPKTVLKEALDEVVCLIGSVAASRKLSDDLVRILVSRLERVRVRALRRLSGGTQGEPKPQPLHAAVEEFLFRNSARFLE